MVFGATGMLGHRVIRELASRGHTVAATSREGVAAQALSPRYLSGVDAWEEFSVDSVRPLGNMLDRMRPEAVVNAIGLVKQRKEADLAVPAIRVNALFPQELAAACRQRRIRVVHVSTDCVFSGRRGQYVEPDVPDALDLYGRTKALGEIDGAGCVTLRTSMIGWELRGRNGLLEWLGSQRGMRIRGFRRAIFSGLSAAEVARVIGNLLDRWPALDGLWHVSASAISKYDLLTGMRDALGWRDIVIEPDDEFCCDRSLNSERFRKATDWEAPEWPPMLGELASDRAGYDSEGAAA